MSTLVYLLYGGNEDYHLELTYSVLTARRFCPQARLALITDQQTTRDDLPLEHVRFTPDELSEWTFGGRFNHAAKIGALQKAAAMFPGKVCLIDTDTYFLGNPDKLFHRGDVVMHADEGTLAAGFPNYSALIARADLDAHSHMINSGIVCLSEQAKALLPEAMEMTRRLVDQSDTYIHTLEQYSLGVTLGNRFKVRFSDDLVRHYHGYERRFIHKRIRDLFPDFSRQRFQRLLMSREEIGGFPPSPRINVALSKIEGLRNRGLGNYAFAHLCSLNARRARDPFAAAWAKTAIDVATHNAYPEEVTCRLRPSASLPAASRFSRSYS